MRLKVTIFHLNSKSARDANYNYRKYRKYGKCDNPIVVFVVLYFAYFPGKADRDEELKIMSDDENFEDAKSDEDPGNMDRIKQ